jgi:2-dehydropantoate 2-reductase
VRFVILGAGALGSILAIHLQRAGHEVLLIARGRRAQYLQHNELALQGLVDYRARCSVVTDPASLETADVLITTTKTYDHQAAIEQVRHIDVGSVFSVANGVLKTEQLANVFGAERTLGCMADFSGELLLSGEVLFTRNVSLQIGVLSPKASDSAGGIAEAIDTAGINCRSVADIRSVEWSKFVPWVALMPISVITRLPTYKFLLDPDAAATIYTLIREMAELARKLNMSLIDQSPVPALSISTMSEDQAIERFRQMGETYRDKVPDHRMSSLQDLENGRRLEVEETLGDALARGAHAGVAMPGLQTCYRLVSTINRVLVGA